MLGFFGACICLQVFNFAAKQKYNVQVLKIVFYSPHKN